MELINSEFSKNRKDYNIKQNEHQITDEGFESVINNLSDE
jgi:hypothetical protein